MQAEHMAGTANLPGLMSWREGVVYQIYPRSFADSDGDGVGDLEGIRRHLDHLQWLGVDAVWLSPIYPSPLADWGYDVSDYTGVDPALGTLEGFDRLLAEAHDRGLRLLMDLVPCHTSIEHPWFREHPDWYIWSETDAPPNNWTSAFGGPAWERDPASGRWYLHSFYPEQPDLDWHNAAVVQAVQDVVRFWMDRGVDGFRLDAIDRLVKDPQLRDDPPSDEPFGLPLLEHELGRDLCHSRNGPGTDRALAALRTAAGKEALLVGEVYLPTARAEPYLEHLDRLFVFELLHATWDADALRRAVAGGAALRGRPGAGPAWVLSNHDFGRLAHRFGRENERAAALLMLTLPGTTFIYQGDEIGMGNGPGANPPRDRIGRDSFRHPMQWDASPQGGFTTGDPWLPLDDPGQRNVADQRGAPGSVLSLYRELIPLRASLPAGFEPVDDIPGVVSFRRGDRLVALNLGSERRPLPGGEALLVTAPDALGHDGSLAPHAGAVVAVA
jgi:glycosidase